ncbi:hypothetical protein KAI52_03430 [Candidatus Parcubacteria bacterium]|nr:hypothetical protein [Candidatus Parcubacteria bacterium]
MLKKTDKISKDHFTIILEDVNSKLNGLVEIYSSLNEKVDNLDQKVDRNHQEFIEFKNETKSNFQTVFNLLSNIDDDIKDIKSEIIDIRKTLTQKADLDRVDALEKRVKILEIKLLERCAA